METPTQKERRGSVSAQSPTGNEGAATSAASPIESTRVKSSKRRNDSKPLGPVDSSAVALLKPLWTQALEDLKKTEVPEEKIYELLTKLATSLEDAEDPTEATYLLALPLPEAVNLVLDAKFLTDRLHKQATNFMQASLNFCLGAVAMDTKRFAKHAFRLMSQIFRHQHFQEVMSMTAPAPAPSDSSASASSNSASVGAGKTPAARGGLSFADVVKTRASLTASRTAKTLTRLTEAVTLFTRQDGYNIIISALENADILDIDTVYTIMDAVISMNQYIGVPFLRQQLPPLLRAVYPKLLSFIPFKDDDTKDLFFQIRDMVMLEATQHVRGDPILTEMTQRFIVDYTSQMLQSIDRSVSVLFLGYSNRVKKTMQIDISKMTSVRDLRSAVAAHVAPVAASQIVIATIKQGRLNHVHQDNAHIFSVHVDIGESIVAYEIPVLNRKQDSPVMLQIVQTKPADRHFVPFFVFASGDKQLTPKWLYETIGGAYIFSSQNSMEQAMKLRLVSPTGTSTDLLINSSKSLPALSPVSSSALYTLSAAADVHVEWGSDVSFEELQGYDKEQYYRTESVINWTLQEFQNFGIGGAASLADHLCNVPASPSEAFSSIQRFVSRVYDVICSAVDRVSLKLAAQVFAGLAKQGNAVMKKTILAPLQASLVARFTVLIESTDPQLRAASAAALCELSSTQTKAIDLLPFSRATGFVEDDAPEKHSPSRASVPLHGGLQFLMKLNLFRTVDLSYIATADPKTELFWYLPLILKTIKQEPSHTPRSSVVAIMKTLQKRQFLAQTAMWLRITRFVGDDDLPGGIDWASSQRFADSRDFFAKIGAAMPEKGTTWANLNILDPIFENEDGSCRVITQVVVKKIFSSKAKPCLLEVTYKRDPQTSNAMKSSKSDLDTSSSSTSSKKSGSSGKRKHKPIAASPPPPATPETGLFIFKKGDDLRVDMLVQTMFYIFNTIWANSGLKHVPFTHQYKIMPMGADIGAVEFVTGSESIQTFDWNSWRNLTAEQRSIFIRSAAGGYVAGWVLGIRDRHQDNMMVRHGHIFYQIDFGHMFNEKPTIDAPRFSIPDEMKTVMSSEEWELFKDVCADAFRALHRMSNVIISLCLSMYEGVEDVDIAKVRKFITSDQGLMVTMSESEACAKIKNLIESGVGSWFRMNKYRIHTVFAAGGTKAPAVSAAPGK